MKHQKKIKLYFNKKVFVILTMFVCLFFCAYFVILSVATADFTEQLEGDDITFFIVGAGLVLFNLISYLFTGCDAHMVFTEEGIEFRQIFKKTEFHSYREYAYVEKAYYPYYGMPMWYMVLSNRRLRNEERCQINAVSVSPSMIKIRYNKKNYEAVLSIVPSRIALSLKAQFKDIPAKRFNFLI